MRIQRALGAIHVHNDDDVIVVAVQPGSFNLRECVEKTFLMARGTCRQEVALRLLNIRAYRQGVQQAGKREA